MAISTSMVTSFKSELFSAGHCFNATVTPTGSAGSGAFLITSISSMVGIAVGMLIVNGNIPSNTYVSAINSSSSITISQATTGIITAGTLTISGDVFKMALIKSGMSGTYSAVNVNYTDITGNTDEVVGSGYTATGTSLTNVSPASSGTTAFITFSPNPSWTSATFSTAGCMIYNSSVRNGGTSGTNGTGAGRCCSVHDFSGVQTVTSGTFTILLPAADATHSILRIA